MPAAARALESNLMPERQPKPSKSASAESSAPSGWLSLLPLLLLVLHWAGEPATEPGALADDLPVMEDEPFVFEPSVVAELVFDTPGAPVPWGSFDLSAAPEHDEIRVDLLIGRAAQSPRWRACDRVALSIDGARVEAPAEYAGVPMPTGAWDAVTAHVTIAEVRQMYDARTVRAHVCGETFTIPAAERVRLASFVREFDDIALWVGPSMPTPPPELGDEHEWLPPEWSEKPHPA